MGWKHYIIMLALCALLLTGCTEQRTEEVQVIFTPDPNSGPFIISTLEIAIEANDPSVQLYYILGDVEASLNSLMYSGPFRIAEDTTVSVAVFKDGKKIGEAKALYALVKPEPEEVFEPVTPPVNPPINFGPNVNTSNPLVQKIINISSG